MVSLAYLALSSLTCLLPLTTPVGVFWPTKMLPKSSLLKMRFLLQLLIIPVVLQPDHFFFFKHDDRNWEQGFGEDLQAEILPLISSLK